MPAPGRSRRVLLKVLPKVLERLRTYILDTAELYPELQLDEVVDWAIERVMSDLEEGDIEELVED